MKEFQQTVLIHSSVLWNAYTKTQYCVVITRPAETTAMNIIHMIPNTRKHNTNLH